jgi:malonate-semialdehyde dehydrogenase (acetylating)/methylmalonate-semialdehyde dehydrogenase
MGDVVNPATMKVIAKCPISTREEMDSAGESAKEAFPDWRRTTPLAQSRILFRLKELLEDNLEELEPDFLDKDCVSCIEKRGVKDEQHN